MNELQGLFGRSAVQMVVFLGLVVVLLTIRLLRSRGAWRLADAGARMALTAALAVVLALTLRPFARPGTVARMLMLDPVEGAWGWDQIAWNPVIDNVALFVPLGALAVAAFWRRSLVVVWLATVLLSVSIETLQYLVPTGRVANSADVLANAVGALLGVGLGWVFRIRRPPRRRERPREHAGSTAG